MPFINERLYANPALMRQFEQNEYPKLEKAFRGRPYTLGQSCRTVNYEEDAYLYCVQSPHLEVRGYTFAFVHKGCVITITSDYRMVGSSKDYKNNSEMPFHWIINGIGGTEGLIDLVHTLQLLKDAFISYGGIYGADLAVPITVSCLVYPERANPEFLKILASVFTLEYD